MPKQTKCPFCAKEVSVDAKKCPYCREWIESHNESIKAKSKINKKVALIIITILILSAFGTVGIFLGACIAIYYLLIYYGVIENTINLKEIISTKKLSESKAQKLYSKGKTVFITEKKFFPDFSKSELLNFKLLNSNFDQYVKLLKEKQFANTNTIFYRKKNFFEMFLVYSGGCLAALIIFVFTADYYLNTNDKPKNSIKAKEIKTVKAKEAEAAPENNKKIDFKKPFNSPWDGSVLQVYNYLQNNLKDRQSYESIEWSEVIENQKGFMVRHKYRAKNGFGGYNIENQLFYMDKEGNVINVVDF